MAFRPMEFFRKQKKVIFALLTIMCMFIFVFTGVIGSGGEEGARAGSWFKRSWLGRLFRSQADIDQAKFAEVAGDTLEWEQMYRLNRQRMATFDFVSTVVGTGRERLDKDLQQAGLTKEELEHPAVRQFKIEDLKDSRRDLYDSEHGSRNTLAQSYRLSLLAQIDILRQEAAAERQAPFLNLGGLARPKSSVQPPMHPRSLVLFSIWKSKARDLKINLSPARVQEDLIRAAAGRISEADFESITQRLIERYRGIDPNFETDVDMLMSWVKEEYEAMMARGLLLGHAPQPELEPADRNPNLPPPPPPVDPFASLPSPLELWDTYVKLNTNLEVGILELPVDDFLSQVTGQPSDEELRTLFAAHKTDLPNELSKKPGFKLPKLYRIEFLYANLRDNTHYGKQAEVSLAAGQRAAHFLHSAAPGGVYLDPYQLQLHTRYLAKRQDRYQITDFGALMGAGEPGPAVIAGRAAAILGAGTDPLAIVATSAAVLRKTKVEPRPPHPLEALAFAPTTASTALPWGLAMLARIADPVYEPLDDTKVIVLTEEIKEEVRGGLLVKDFKELQAELEKWRKSNAFVKAWGDWQKKYNQDVRQGKPPTKPLFEPPPIGEDRLPYKEYLSKWAQARDVRFDIQMEGLRPRDKLLNEEGAKPLSILREAFSDAGSDNEDSIERQLAGEPMLTGQGGTGVFEGQLTVFGDALPRDRHRLAMYWKAEQHDERVPTFEEKKPIDVEAMVRTAWKRDKARGLAEAKMKELADKVRATQPDGYRHLKDEPHYHAEVTIGRHELSGLGSPTALSSYIPGVLPSYIRDDKPPAGLLENLVKELHTPGQVLTAANQPETEFYIFVLMKRIEPRADDPVWVKKFARDLPTIRVKNSPVEIPDRFLRQLVGPLLYQEMRMKPLADQVLYQGGQDLISAWEAYELKRAGYDEEKGNKLAEELQSRQNR